MFAPTVAAAWRTETPGVTAVPDLDPRVSVLVVPDGEPVVLAAPDLAAALGGGDRDEVLAAAGITLHEPDRIHHLPLDRRAELAAAGDADGVRLLTAADAAAFAEFEAACPEDDRENAYVELDHWAVYGALVDGRIVAAASAYGWNPPGATDSALADIGVLTRPDARGQGHGVAVVEALARHILAAGQEPLYRCTLDNLGSAGVARRAGFAALGDWSVALGD